jgi:hypothetical protein
MPRSRATCSSRPRRRSPIARSACPASTQIFDVSNACLGFLNSIVVAAGMIDSGQIESALIVAGENGRPLVEETMRTLLAGSLDRNGDQALLRQPDDRLRRRGRRALPPRLVAGEGGHRLLGGVAAPPPSTASSAKATPPAPAASPCRPTPSGCWRPASRWQRTPGASSQRRPAGRVRDVDNVICHQVGSAHRRRLFETLGLDVAKDYSTFETLGNMGSVSLPATLAAATEAGAVRRGDQVALMGIGSGLNCLMLALEW